MFTGRSTPRAYQDERFSYVVLRRSPRPADAPELSIRRQLNSQPELDPDQYRSEPNALNVSRARRLVRCLLPCLRHAMVKSGLRPLPKSCYGVRLSICNLQVGEYSGEVSAAEEDEDASDDDDLSGAMRAAELAAFADLDPEARRLVLESIAGSVSDDEDDEESAGLAAVLVAEAERLEQLASARAEQHEDVHAEDWRHGFEEPSPVHADSISTSSEDSIGSRDGVHSSEWSSVGEAVDLPEPLQQTATSSLDVASPAEQLGDSTHATEDVIASLDPQEPPSAGITEPDDTVDQEEPVDWEQRDPEAVATCVGASGDWSRIVRRAVCSLSCTSLRNK